jgi:Spy/CpxP family protein refolding chaperone
MKKFKILFLFLSVFVFAGTYFLGSASAMKHPNFMRHKFMRCRKMDMMGMFNIFMLKNKLHLTKNQLHQIKIIKRQEFTAFKSNIRNFRNPLLSAMKSGTFNKNVFVANITNKVKNMAEIKANFLTKFFNVLTPAQRSRFVFLMKKKIHNRIKRLEFMKKMLNKRIKIMNENLSE